MTSRTLVRTRQTLSREDKQAALKASGTATDCDCCGEGGFMREWSTLRPVSNREGEIKMQPANGYFCNKCIETWPETQEEIVAEMEALLAFQIKTNEENYAELRKQKRKAKKSIETLKKFKPTTPGELETVLQKHGVTRIVYDSD